MTPNFFSRRQSSGEAEPTPTSLRPQPPLARRLNRNALTVAAVIMGMTVLTAIVLLSPGRDQEKASKQTAAGVDEPPAVPPRPAFLDEPVHQTTADSGSAHRADSASAVTLSPSPATGQAASAVSPRAAVDALSPAPTTTPSNSRNDGASSRNAEESPRERAYQAALASAPVVSATVSVSTATPNGSAASLATEEEQMVSLGDSILRSTIRPSASAGSAVPTAGAGSGATLTSGASQRTATSDTAPPDAARSFASRAAARAGGTTIAELEPAGSPFTLTAGTVIPGLLLTAINSDLPGEIVGQVSRPVYDSRTQRIVLIPRGSRLIGTYDNQIAAGQGRLLVAWTRLIFPDGRSLRLPGLALADPAGQSGAPGNVDNHWRRVFGNALLLSAISAGAQLSQPAQATVLSTFSAGQVAAGAVGQELSRVAIEILRRGMDVAPTITIRAGQPFNVFLSGDLVFDGPADTSH